MKEKWYVVVVTFQFASLTAANAVMPLLLMRQRNGGDIFTLLFFCFCAVLFGWLTIHLARTGFVYLGCEWAGTAKPPRLDPDQCWAAIIKGSMIGLLVSLGILEGELWSILLGCYGFLFGLCANLWAIDELRRNRECALVENSQSPKSLPDDRSVEYD